MATAIKGDPVRVFDRPWAANVLSDVAIDCRGYNAVNVQVFVSGTSPSVTITVEGASAAGANYQTLPDPNAIQRSVAADVSYEVNVGTPWMRIRLSSISGTFANGQGYMIVVTPYVSAGSRQRPAWWDRNPIAQNVEYSAATVAPDASGTVRFTYTVPAGKGAMVTSLATRLIRETAATAAGQASARIRLNGTQFISAVVLSNTVGATDGVAVGQAMLLAPDDVLTGHTFDLSTGGTFIYLLAATIVEFDA